MQPDEARLQDVRAWLSKAELDLKAAGHEVSAPAEALWGDVMFHAQQAAEKSMKAFLAWHDVPFRKTHNLEELGRQCVALDTTLGPVADQAAPLTEYAWKFRYPGAMNPTARERKKRSRQPGTFSRASWPACPRVRGRDL